MQARGQLEIPSDEDESDDRPAPDLDNALAAFGLVLEDGESAAPPPLPKCYLWPCNLPTWRAWQRLQSQWRSGATGMPTGLDYASVNSFLRHALHLGSKSQAGMFDQLQAMEFSALKGFAERAENSQHK